MMMASKEELKTILMRIDGKGMRTILYGSTTIDLSCLEQLVDPAQTLAIARMIHYYNEHYLEKTQNLREGLTRVLTDVREQGFDVPLPYKSGELAIPRLYELAGAVNRMRTSKII